MLPNLISFIWGFAEATLFFFVPDIALSVIALHGIDLGLEASVYALTGAMVGGWIMYCWGRSKLDRLLSIFLKLPAIRNAELEQVKEGFEKRGIMAVLWGPLLGIPYKIYAAYAHQFVPLFVFMLISIPARVIRFVFVVLLTPLIARWIVPNSSLPTKTIAVLSLWALFYTFYFYTRRK